MPTRTIGRRRGPTSFAHRSSLLQHPWPEFRRNLNLPEGQANSPFAGQQQLAATSPAGGRNLNRNRRAGCRMFPDRTPKGGAGRRSRTEGSLELALSLNPPCSHCCQALCGEDPQPWTCAPNLYRRHVVR